MPDNLNSLERQVLEAIESKISPWVKGGAPVAVMDAPPFVVARGKPNITIRETPAEPLPMRHSVGGDARVQHWLDRNFNASNMPRWGCVMEGEIDLEMGITEEICQMRKISPAQWIVALPARTFFWVKPGVPIARSGLHWRRPNPEKALSRILWMHLTPAGVGCHFCSTSKGQHWEHPHVFVPNQNLWPLVQQISNELESRSRYYESMMEYSMLMLSLQMIRSIREQFVFIPAVEDTSPVVAYDGDEQVIRQALSYIRDHFLNAGLVTEDVAQHVHLSTTHLKRLFRQHLHSSVRQIIIDQRFEHACHLLEQSKYSIRQISFYCGYSHASTFVTAFAKRYGKSPLAYRQEYQKYSFEKKS